MKVILAQGNPGLQYANTRHNIGFRILDTLALEHDGSFKDSVKFHALICEIQQGSEKILLVKPQTFYNETGRAARAIIDFYKLDPAQDLLVVHDELALPFGTLRIRNSGSDGGNNGIKSLNSHLGPAYLRLRIGIANEQRAVMGDSDFVLANFSKDESALLHEKIIPAALEKIEAFATHSLELHSQSL